MSRVISMEAAYRVWMAHREIAAATKLLADIEEASRHGGDPTPIDAFGRQRMFSLGVPHGDNSQRLLNVSNKLAQSVIRAHIAAKERDLIEASEMARLELDGEAPN